MIRRILFSTDTLARGGKERQMAMLAKALLKREYVLIFVAKRTDPESNYFCEYGLDPALIRLYRGFASFSRVISEFSPDIVVSWDIKSSFYNLLLHRWLRFKFINGSIRHGIRAFKPDHLFRTVVCHLSPWVMANSHAGLQANNLRENRRRLVLYNGVEQRFGRSISDRQREELRDSLIPGHRFKPATVFLSVANFVPYKDYFTVFKALAGIRKQFDFRYLIAGDGPLKSAIEAAIREYGLEDNVMLMGRRSDIEDLLSVSDIFIHSSKGEGVSNAILEAMQAGLPVVASDVGGVRETVFPSTSYLFPFGDADALEEVLMVALRRAGLKELKSKAYRAHLNKFSDETMVSGFLEILSKVSGKMDTRAPISPELTKYETL